MDFARYFLAMITVLGLMVLFALFLKFYGMRISNYLTHNKYNFRLGSGKQTPRLINIKESLNLDPRRRLILIEVKGKDYLLLLSPNGDMQLGEQEFAKVSNKPARDRAGNQNSEMGFQHYLNQSKQNNPEGV